MKRFDPDEAELTDEEASPSGSPEDGRGRRLRRSVRPLEMLPTLVTLGNLFSGFLAIAYLTDSLHTDSMEARVWLYEKAIFLIFLAMVFDALDGWVARKTGHSSDFGAQVDSICDAVSFGAAPALLFKVVCEADPTGIKPKMALVIAVLFLACAVLRLARFNMETGKDEESHQGFEGLPTPAAAAVVASLAYANIVLDPETASSWIKKALPFVMVALGFLMVSRLPYIHAASWLLRRKSYSTMVLVMFLVGVIVLEHELLLPSLCVAFALWGPAVFLWRGVRRQSTEDPGVPDAP